MEILINIEGKPVQVRMTDKASRQLDIETGALVVEMELYFSCLIRKRVLFQASRGQTPGVQVLDKLFVQFRPVMTRHCNSDFEGEAPPLTEFPLEDARPFIPKWLQLDYRKGNWRGEFGY